MVRLLREHGAEANVKKRGINDAKGNPKEDETVIDICSDQLYSTKICGSNIGEKRQAQKN